MREEFIAGPRAARRLLYKRRIRVASLTFGSGPPQGRFGIGAIRTVGPAETKACTRLLTFDHEELVGRGFGPPNLAFATSELPHAGIAVG